MIDNDICVICGGALSLTETQFHKRCDSILRNRYINSREERRRIKEIQSGTKIRNIILRKEVSRDVSGYVYFILDEDRNLVKIGKTNNITIRFYSITSHNSGIIKLLGYIKSDNSYKTEHDLHKKFCDYIYRREWFVYSDEIKEFIKNNCNMENLDEV